MARQPEDESHSDVSAFMKQTLGKVKKESYTDNPQTK
jgi:hypothetical protein